MTIATVSLPESIRWGAAREHSRYAINGCECRSDGNGGAFLTVTDGRLLAIRKADADLGDAKPFIIPGGMLPRKKAGDVVTLDSAGKLSGLKSRITDEPMAAAFPPCHDVLPDPTETTKGGKLRYDRVLTLSVALLHSLARAICSRDNDTLRVTLLLAADGKPIAVLAAGDDPTESLGVLMPCSGDDREKFASTYTARRDSYRAACQQ